MKIAICDDDKAVGTLRGFIRQYAARRMLDYTILEFDQSERSCWKRYRRNPDIRILFWTSTCPLSGWIWRKRSGRRETVRDYFVTSTDHYAGELQVNAEHYLVKPITYSRVETA